MLSQTLIQIQYKILCLSLIVKMYRKQTERTLALRKIINTYLSHKVLSQMKSKPLKAQ